MIQLLALIEIPGYRGGIGIHPGTFDASELHGEMTDAAGTAVNQDLLPFFDPAVLDQGLPGGMTGQWRGSTAAQHVARQ